MSATAAAPATPTGPPASAAANAPRRPLDDIMIAMDVVDTLRQDARIVERELNEEGRRADLIRRLREIYHGQGIEVPDAILEEGVKALEEKRFVYDPPKDGLAVRIARLYVSRDVWGRWVIGITVGVLAVWAGWWLGVERPRYVAQQAVYYELQTTLPERISALSNEIAGVTTVPAVRAEAATLAEAARAAARGGRADEARQLTEQLARMRTELGQDYELRIVSEAGKTTGLWRVPRINPTQRNYYLVVQAIDRAGTVLSRPIVSEEDGTTRTVSTWAQRVPKQTFEAVQADKQDDGIIQNLVLGRKVMGELEPRWTMPVDGGALTEW